MVFEFVLPAIANFRLVGPWRCVVTDMQVSREGLYSTYLMFRMYRSTELTLDLESQSFFSEWKIFKLL